MATWGRALEINGNSGASPRFDDQWFSGQPNPVRASQNKVENRVAFHDRTLLHLCDEMRARDAQNGHAVINTIFHGILCQAVLYPKSLMGMTAS